MPTRSLALWSNRLAQAAHEIVGPVVVTGIYGAGRVIRHFLTNNCLDRRPLRTRTVPIGVVGLVSRLAQRFAKRDDIGVVLPVAEGGACPEVQRLGILRNRENRLIDPGEPCFAVVNDALQLLGCGKDPVDIARKIKRFAIGERFFPFTARPVIGLLPH